MCTFGRRENLDIAANPFCQIPPNAFGEFLEQAQAVAKTLPLTGHNPATIATAFSRTEPSQKRHASEPKDSRPRSGGSQLDSLAFQPSFISKTREDGFYDVEVVHRSADLDEALRFCNEEWRRFFPSLNPPARDEVCTHEGRGRAIGCTQ